MFVRPPLLLLFAITVSFLVSRFTPSLHISADFFPVVGVILLATGLGLFVWTVQFFQKHKTTLEPRGKPSALITTGPYAISRNPIYLGFLLVATGTAMVFANILAFIGPIMFFFFIQTLVIPFEEGMLTKIFGDFYQTYRKKIRRWL